MLPCVHGWLCEAAGTYSTFFTFSIPQEITSSFTTASETLKHKLRESSTLVNIVLHTLRTSKYIHSPECKGELRELPHQEEGWWATWDLPGGRKPSRPTSTCRKATQLAEQAGSLRPDSHLCQNERRARHDPFPAVLLLCHNRLGSDRLIRRTKGVLCFLLNWQSFFQSEVWESFSTGIFIMLW